MTAIYPFKFLDSYTAQDTEIFFGRDQEIEDLYQMCFQADILLVYGASGTGKTSLIQCGLASKFQSRNWLDIYIRRSGDINLSLEKGLASFIKKNETKTVTDDDDLSWLDEMDSEPAAVQMPALSPLKQQLKDIYLQHFRPIYLIFDQFEELFILGSKAEQAQFVEAVKEMLQVEQPVKLIFSVREEYLGTLYEFEKAVPELLRKKMRIEPMNLEKVREVVLGINRLPKSIVHIKQGEEEAVAQQIFEKIRGKEKTLTIQLPYLQVFLDKLYRHISKDKSREPSTHATFSLAALQEIGDIGDILRDFIEEQTVEIAGEVKTTPETIWKILSPLVTLEDTKEPIGMKDLYNSLLELPKELINKVINELINRRILRFLEEDELYEVAHDSLALAIASKRSDEEIALLEVKRLIKSQTNLKADARELFSEKQLNFMEPFLPKIKLEAAETAFITESRKALQERKEAEERERKEKEAKRRRNLKIIATITVAIVLILSALVIWALIAQSDASEKARIAQEKEDIANQALNEQKRLEKEAKDKTEAQRRKDIEAAQNRYNEAVADGNNDLQTDPQQALLKAVTALSIADNFDKEINRQEAATLKQKAESSVAITKQYEQLMQNGQSQADKNQWKDAYQAFRQAAAMLVDAKRQQNAKDKMALARGFLETLFEALCQKARTMEIQNAPCLYQLEKINEAKGLEPFIDTKKYSSQIEHLNKALSKCKH